MTRARPLIAIDGPAGSGKSTLARRLAEELDLPYVNTGLMYRWLTLRAVREGVDPDDAEGLAALAARITFELNESMRPAELLIDGAVPGSEVSSPEVESRVSRVSGHSLVRDVLRAAQRRLAEGGGVVEGRDIGAIVAPGADAKLFLEADEVERVARRAGERRVPDAAVGGALAERDALDARTNPLVPAEDAVAIDTTRMDPDLVFRTALSVVRARLSEAGW